MPLWTLFGLRKGKATTDWQEGDQEDRDNGQDGVLGMPRFEPRRYAEECVECARICPTAAIRVSPKQTGRARLEVDYGRCVVCQLCVEVCPTDAATTSRDWAFGTRDRFDLLFSNDDVHIIHESAGPHCKKWLSPELHIRHVDAGSCNGCELGLRALDNPFYNLHRFGVFFAPSPRFADLLLVTGPVTYAMHEPLLRTYEAMPEPRWVMAAGTCAVSGGVAGGGYAAGTA